MVHPCVIGAPKTPPTMPKPENPTDFAIKIPDASSHEAAAVEMFRTLAHSILKETGDPQFVINAMFGAVVTVVHDTGADPWRLQTAFRKMSDMVHQIYNQRDGILSRVGGGKAN